MPKRWSVLLYMGLFSGAYALSFVEAIPAWRYFPLQHAWGWTGAFPDPSMAWFWKVGLGLCAGLLGWLLGLALERWRPEPPRWVDWMSWTLLGLALAVSTHHEWAKWISGKV